MHLCLTIGCVLYSALPKPLFPCLLCAQQASASRPLSTVPALPLLELAPGISDVAQLSAALHQEKKRLEGKRCSAAASQHVVVQQLVRLRSLDRQLVLMSLRLQTRPGSLDLIHDPALEMKADTIFRQKTVHSLYKGMAALLTPRLV